MFVERKYILQCFFSSLQWSFLGVLKGPKLIYKKGKSFLLFMFSNFEEIFIILSFYLDGRRDFIFTQINFGVQFLHKKYLSKYYFSKPKLDLYFTKNNIYLKIQWLIERPFLFKLGTCIDNVRCHHLFLFRVEGMFTACVALSG